MTADDTKTSLSLSRARPCSELCGFAITTCHLSFQDASSIREPFIPGSLNSAYKSPNVLGISLIF